LEEMFAGQTEAVASQLARHFEGARRPAKAAAFRLQAGNQARRVSAHSEAADHLNRGLELAGEMPPGPERTRLELDLNVSLGKALLALHGYASHRVDRVFARARELCQVLGDASAGQALIQVLLAQAAFHLMRADLEQAQQDAQQVLVLAQRAREDGVPEARTLILTSHLVRGAAALYRANYESARADLEEVIALYDPAQHQALAYQQGQDPGVQAISFLSRVLWLQGYPEQALARCAQADALARQLNHPYSSTIAALHASTIRAWFRWWVPCQTHAERALELARRGGFKMREANAIILHGIALAHQGHSQMGISEIRQGLFGWEASGAGLVAYGRASLAEAHLLAGRHQEGLRAVEESLYPSQETWWLPEQRRLRAELLLGKAGAEAEAETLLQQAADLAASQKARSLELRALTNLVQLQRQKGRQAAWTDRLAQCYAGFTEGFDLPDLCDAQALLEELGAQPGRRAVQTAPRIE
jgi:tetratricopeptide (TPR) repeat protein